MGGTGARMGKPGIVAVALGALLLGIVIGGRRDGGGAIAQGTDPGAAATATRAAEIAELAQLRTQVAEAVCSPAPAATPAGTPVPVPPAATGQPLPYGDGWTVTVHAAADLAPTDGPLAVGRTVRVDLTLVNAGPEARQFPFSEWRLLDGLGRTYVVSIPGTTAQGINLSAYIAPTLPNESAIVFEVLPDTQGPFVLESTTEPAFRVGFELEQRG